MARRSEVWVEDLISVLAALHPDPGDLDTLMKVLQLDHQFTEPEPDKPRPGLVDDNELVVAPPAPPPPAPPKPDQPSPTRTSPVLEPIQPTGRVRSQVPDVVTSTPVEPEEQAHYHRPEYFEPLLRPEWTRGVVHALGQTQGPGGDIDITKLVDEVAHARVPSPLPRLKRLTLARGLQVLVDTAEGLEPFIRDQDELVELIPQVVGRELVHTLFFLGCPTRSHGAGPGDVYSWSTYAPPAPGTPVVALTDLGIGGPAIDDNRGSIEEWFAFDEWLRKRHSRLYVFLPYPPDRWPTGAADVLNMSRWDRSTSRAAVRHLVRRQQT